MTEALQPLLPGASDRLIKRMQDYQCHMGDIQDATVLRAGLEKFFRKHKCRSAAATRLLSKLNRRRVALVAAFMKIANTLSDFAPPEQRPSGLRTPDAGRLRSK
jgi:CHAD domain-containing protein